MRGTIVIKETKEEYLLNIPASQKERARGIESRRWDPQRTCWVYPRNARIYNALVAEFGDDLTQSSSFTPPTSFRGAVKPEEEKERAEFQGDIRRIDQSLSKLLETFSNFLSDTDANRANILMNKESEIQSLKSEVQEKDSENLVLERQCSQLREEVATLGHRIEQLEAENSRLSGETETMSADKYAIVKSVAMDGIGTDLVFGDEVRKLQIDEELPIYLGSMIEEHLKRVLDVDDGNLYDLIVSCRDAEIFDKDTAAIAHTIRVQRNFAAHPRSDDDKKTRTMRAIFCLFGAVMLLPKLSSKLRGTKD